MNESELNPWLMHTTSSSSSSPHQQKNHFISMLLKNFSFNASNNSAMYPPPTNETRVFMNYFHQYILSSLYNPYQNSSSINDSLDYITCPSIQYPMKNVVAIILYLVVCIVGLFGNSLVIYVVMRFSKMQTVTNRYILNLACADQCFLIGIPFLLTTMYLNEWIFGPILCKLYMISTSITQFTSSIFLLIMSADRFIAVCHPISSPRFRTPLVSKFVSFFAWGLSALIMLPIFFYGE
jgi:allatostatin C receptor